MLKRIFNALMHGATKYSWTVTMELLLPQLVNTHYRFDIIYYFFLMVSNQATGRC